MSVDLPRHRSGLDFLLGVGVSHSFRAGDPFVGSGVLNVRYNLRVIGVRAQLRAMLEAGAEKRFLPGKNPNDGWFALAPVGNFQLSERLALETRVGAAVAYGAGVTGARAGFTTGLGLRMGATRIRGLFLLDAQTLVRFLQDEAKDLSVYLSVGYGLFQ